MKKLLVITFLLGVMCIGASAKADTIISSLPGWDASRLSDTGRYYWQIKDPVLMNLPMGAITGINIQFLGIEDNNPLDTPSNNFFFVSLSTANINLRFLPGIYTVGSGPNWTTWTHRQLNDTRDTYDSAGPTYRYLTSYSDPTPGMGDPTDWSFNLSSFINMSEFWPRYGMIFGIEPDCSFGFREAIATVTYNNVPEPSMILLLGSGLFGLGFLLRRKKNI